MLGNAAHILNGNIKKKQIIKEYKRKVKANRLIFTEKIKVDQYFKGGAGNSTVKLKCWYIKSKIPLFRGNFDDGYQYDLRSQGYGRPKAWRVKFLKDVNFNNQEYTVSHLCHDNQCYNYMHHVLETLKVNKSRNGCPGGGHCHHRTTCIRPGKYYNK